MEQNTILQMIDSFWNKNPDAFAEISGSIVFPTIHGIVQFYPVKKGSIVISEIRNLPEYTPGNDSSAPIGPFGFHIHEGSTCNNDPSNTEAFNKTGMHYNPYNTKHPEHAGDLPVLFSNKGYSFMAIFTDKFQPIDILNKTIIIHQSPDDFRTQPSGNSGTRIACGVIEKYR